MEICLNEYIRTKNGKIDKVINDNYYISEYIECEKGIVDKENIVNHSFNITDLIEEGDIVNGQRVLYIEKEGLVIEMADYIFPYISIKEIKIEEILTHEQYERNCYRLENN